LNRNQRGYTGGRSFAKPLGQAGQVQRFRRGASSADRPAGCGRPTLDPTLLLFELQPAIATIAAMIQAA